MSGVWGWFGGGAAQKKKDTPKNAILALRGQLEMLQKREKHIMVQMEEQDAIARKNVNSNKAAAKAALRRKKTQEHNLEQTIAQINTLEEQVNAIEKANIQKETLRAMEGAGKAMQTIHGNLTPEKVDDIMDKIREQNDLGDEIQQAIASNPIGFQADDKELEDEFDQMQQEQLDKEMLTSGNPPINDAVTKMPAAGNAPIPSKPQAVEDSDDEEELKKLQAEMAV